MVMSLLLSLLLMMMMMTAVTCALRMAENEAQL